MPKITNDWLDVIGDEFNREYYLELRKFLVSEYSSKKIFPEADNIFNAFHYTPFSKVKVVILGQDPYHNDGQAHGLSFSVNKNIPIPPSLLNIYKELETELGLYIPNNGYLKKWAEQGVLLLNAVLTVRAHQAYSHANMGWEKFTDFVIEALGNREEPVVFLLWGRPAQMKESLIKGRQHLVLKAPHPSPLSAYRGFFGCNHFIKTNEFLRSMGSEPIDWQIENV